MPARAVLAASLFAGLCTLATVAPVRADVIPPEQSICTGKKDGDACTASGKDGFCAASTCTRLDYSTTPPKSVNYACLVCTPKSSSSGCAAGRPADPGVSPGQLALLLLAPILILSPALRRRRRDASAA